MTGVPAVVRWPDGREVADDANGFVTALAVRDLRRAGVPAPPAWLELLASCRRPDASYGFWPVGGSPSWAPDLPPDSDDTAVLLLELVLAGRVSRDDARRAACRTIGAHRLSRVLDPGPPWLRRGMFATWQRPGPGPGLVDLTAVANVVALLHALDLTGLPGVAESVAALEAAADWAGTSPPRWRSLSPFYPEPDELARALEHAASWGAPGMSAIGAAARRTCPREDPDAVCSMAYGPPTWHSPALAALRAARRRAGGTVDRFIKVCG